MTHPASYQPGHGRLRASPELRRSVRVGVVLRPGEAADLATVAEAWGVSLGTAAWALVAGSLSEMRGQRLTLPPEVARSALRSLVGAEPPA